MQFNDLLKQTDEANQEANEEENETEAPATVPCLLRKHAKSLAARASSRFSAPSVKCFSVSPLRKTASWIVSKLYIQNLSRTT